MLTEVPDALGLGLPQLHPIPPSSPSRIPCRSWHPWSHQLLQHPGSSVDIPRRFCNISWFMNGL